MERQAGALGLRSLGFEKTHLDTDVAEHKLNGSNPVDEVIQVLDGPKCVSRDLSSIPFYGLNPGESGVVVTAPSAVDDNVSVRPRIIDLFQQIQDNIRSIPVLDSKFG